MSKVLIVDDDPVQLRLTTEIARKTGFDVIAASGGLEALSILRSGSTIGAMILDLVMPDLDGMSVMETMARENISVPVIVQTASSSLETVISAMRHGAVDFFVKPVAPERLSISLRNAFQIEELQSCIRTDRGRREGTLGFEDLITRSASMGRAIELSKKAARSNIPVLIEGESGVGKEMIARAIQGASERSGKPFITVNCGAIPENLVESTLFGHVKGAFTGAVSDHAGKFQEAHGGTLFLDEIGELPQDAQVKLLRAIQEGEIEPVGANRPIKVNVRLISATNRRLLNMAKAGTFREDLYYRLNVFPIYVPPLRERLDDIAPLVSHFIARFGAESGRRVTSVSPAALEMLSRFPWPGNIRQLENAVYRAVVLSEEQVLETTDFPQISAHLTGIDQARRETASLPAPSVPTHIDDLTSAPAPRPAPSPALDRFTTSNGEVLSLAEVERELIAFAINQHRGHMSNVAKSLGIGRSTLYRKLKEYGLEEGDDLAA